MSAGALLAPLGWVTGTAAALRRAAHGLGVLGSRRLPAPVVSVGNLSVGGTGKTPLVAFLAAAARDAGYRVAVLSRGYGGRSTTPVLLVSDGGRVLADAAAAGDEPVLLARALPGVVVAVGPRRDVVGEEVCRRFAPQLVLLDDGFQHLRLARDLDVVCVRAEDLASRPLPAGRLREFPRALAAADVAVLSAEPAVDADASAERRAVARLAGLTGVERVVVARRRPLGFFDAAGVPVPAPARPFLFAGIARPGRFEADVRHAAGEPVGTRFFRDHHPFTADDRRAVANAARDAGGDALVTTEKDLARLDATGDSADLGPLPLRTLRVSVALDDEARLVEPVLALARRGTAA
ncbi:MAG: tetraacyldisaccharide 4'-kinase [Vicinamibacteria bacterium]|nr:tetraacyldisaccharide 4'-kinase [Vicinamibacteria bacterium]